MPLFLEYNIVKALVSRHNLALVSHLILMKNYVALGMRNRTLLEGYGVLDSYLKKVPGTKCQIERAVDTGSGFSVRLCYEISDRERIRCSMEEEIKSEKYDQKFFNNIDSAYKRALENIRLISKKHFDKLNGSELLRCFDVFYQMYISTIHPMVLAIYASDLEDLLERELGKIVGKEAKFPIKMTEYKALLLTPTRLSTVQKEEQMLFELQREFETNHRTDRVNFDKFCENKEIKSKIKNIVKSFGWFHMEYIGEAFGALEYKDILWKRITSVKESGLSAKIEISPNDRLKEIKKQQEKFFKTNKCSKFFKDLVFTMQEYMIVLDFSKADLIEGIYHARPFIDEIASRLGFDSWIDVRYLSPKEIKEGIALGKKFNQEYIQERKKNWTLLLENGKIEFFSGEESVKVNEKLIKNDSNKNKKRLEGMVAYPGKVKGVANIITSAKERNKFKTGDVLVARDTTTELTSIIKRASAIVADYGGLLSHTAIVAREFKIPCVVNTKLGTKIIKDGDLLEVDADSGLIKILD